ncbi:MAG: dihydrofolate reductase [Burkholderiaceae bacterium]
MPRAHQSAGCGLARMSPDKPLSVPANLRISLIVARAANGVIGNKNELVWSIPEELKHFKQATMGHALIVGRKTWDSIGRPLPGRRMIVVSRNAGLQADGIEIVASLDQALVLAGTATSNHPTPDAEVFIAGGAQLYEQTTDIASRILVTEVALEPDGDAFFHWQPTTEWSCVARQSNTSTTGIEYQIQDWRRQP